MHDTSVRVAAWVAIAAACAAVATLFVLGFNDLLGVLLAALLLFVAGIGAWIALTRRGTLRALGVVGLVAALAGLAITLVARDLVGELLALAIAVALFTSAGRSALRESRRRDLASGASPRRRGSSGSKCSVLLMNPKSGGGKVEAANLVDECRARGIEPVLLRLGDDLRVLARRAALSADVIGMAGGDGSQALVAQVAMEEGVAFVCVPAGTRNHFALDLGLDRDDLVGALDAFGDGVERDIDLAFVNERVFVNNVSLGIYAQIVQSEAYRDAKVATFETMLPELLGPRATPFDLRFRDENGEGHDSAQLILVSNNPYVLDRLAGVGSRPRLDTGLLGIIAVEISGATQAATLISLETLGQVRRFEGWREWSARRFEVASSGPVAAGVDGEAMTLTPPLRFSVAQGALRVRLPAAAALSPAAATPSLGRDAVHELWEIATSRR